MSRCYGLESIGVAATAAELAHKYRAVTVNPLRKAVRAYTTDYGTTLPFLEEARVSRITSLSISNNASWAATKGEQSSRSNSSHWPEISTPKKVRISHTDKKLLVYRVINIIFLIYNL
jgi:hypothetical protein